MQTLLRFFRNADAQDLVEYAFLCLFVALVTAAGWVGVRTAMKSTYETLDAQEQNLWQPADPAGSSGGS